MPTYTFLNLDSGILYDVEMKISELDAYKSKHPNCQQQLSTPAIVGGVQGISRQTDSGFNDVLKRIKSGAGRGNKIEPR